MFSCLRSLFRSERRFAMSMTLRVCSSVTIGLSLLGPLTLSSNHSASAPQRKRGRVMDKACTKSRSSVHSGITHAINAGARTASIRVVCIPHPDHIVVPTLDVKTLVAPLQHTTIRSNVRSVSQCNVDLLRSVHADSLACRWRAQKLQAGPTSVVMLEGMFEQEACVLHHLNGKKQT